MRRPFIADHVESRQDRSPRGIGDARLAVEDAAHRRLADSRLLGYVCKIARHVAKTIRNHCKPCNDLTNCGCAGSDRGPASGSTTTRRASSSTASFAVGSARMTSRRLAGALGLLIAAAVGAGLWLLFRDSNP